MGSNWRVTTGLKCLANQWVLAVVPMALGMALCTGAAGQTQQSVKKSNMNSIGYNDLQARSAYQPTIEKQGDRYIAYIGHHGGVTMNPLNGKMEPNGTSILDVTDPANLKISGAHSRRAATIQIYRANPAARRWRALHGSSARRQEQILSSAQLRQLSPRNLGCHRSGQAGARSRRLAATFATRTRTGGNATRASRIWFPALLAGARPA